MVRKAQSGSRTAVRGRGWRRTASIATAKYDVISRAILSSLTRSPVTFTELTNRVTERVRAFDGSVPWYTLTCLRELEVQGKVHKHQKPVRYSRVAGAVEQS